MKKLNTVKSILIALAWLAVTAAGQCQEPQRQSAPEEAVDLAAPDAPGLRGTLPVPVQVEPELSALDRTNRQNWCRARLQLAGSMCTACLRELEDKLRRLPGVAFVKIELPNSAATAEDSGLRHREAPAVIIYDDNATSFNSLMRYIKQEKYKALDVKTTSK